ncbi:MAG: hypothetical protein R2684_09490 [Pyrinomonadaceae bacterium]
MKIKTVSQLFLILLAFGIIISIGPVVIVAKPYDSVSFGAEDVTEVTESVYPLNPNGTVSLSNINGSIRVSGWDRNEVKVTARKVASSQERLADLSIKVDSSPSRLDIDVVSENWKGKWSRGDKLFVEFELMVPKTAIINEIETVNGAVTLTELHVKTVASAVNGAVTAKGLRGDVSLSTVNGAIFAEVVEIDPKARISLETVNGAAKLVLPSGANALVKADSVNGPITNNFGLPVRKGKYVGRNLYGKLGNGGPKIELTSVNGALNFSHSGEGKVQNVENLLPQKSEDDYEESLQDSMKATAEIAAAKSKMTAAEMKEVLEKAKEAQKAALAETKIVLEESLKVPLDVIADIDIDPIKLDMEKIRLEAEIARVSNLAGNRSVQYLTEETRSFDVQKDPKVSVKALGCKVIIKGWNQDKVTYKVSTLANGNSSPIADISANQSGRVIKISVNLKDAPDASKVLENIVLEINVPLKTDLRVETDRELRVSHVRGELDLLGSINITDSAGNLSAKNTSGILRVSGFEGSVTAESGDSDSYFDGDFKSIRSTSGIGSVHLSIADETGVVLSAKSVNADGLRIPSSEMLRITPDGFVPAGEGVWKRGDGQRRFDFISAGGKVFVSSPNDQN